MSICKQCGWWDKFCHCHGYGDGDFIDHSWIREGVWEHIDPLQPHMRIDSKEQLIRECEKRGKVAKAFMKHKSQGKGYEHG